jgi:hypothetical protein
MLSEDDATKLAVPLAIYISKDEPLDEVCDPRHQRSTQAHRYFSSTRRSCRCCLRNLLLPATITRATPICESSFIFRGSNRLILSARFHGWAAARADLKNEENRKAYVSCFLLKRYGTTDALFKGLMMSTGDWQTFSRRL